ncbi:UNVERIFIED_CONTAM: hypothetical protein GTU68_053626 [Idotea baltica]|nr:hypothetical protein [Idotea baltica]
MKKKNTFKTFLSDIPQNLFSGFVVSLIALPLGLGLAIASGAPPISGIIAAIIGGTVVSLIGGSNVTITGPGNGLVVVILAAITTLGNGDMQQDFSKILDFNFINAVIGITLIASIESLLSIKAVDKLDPLKRRSNVNKDIRALGLATVISGFLGGLNVVTVIARSSVNVNNKGTNRSANFFHASFLIVFILLFASELRKIPLPALAAILVFTGYKLASPENLRKVFKIGSEQLIIFLITLLTTITTSLITGIIVGILATFIIHIIINKSVLLFIKNSLKPNVLMFKEDGKYYVSVKNFSSFLNYTKLKVKLDQIPENEDAIVDFSLCDFVDHSVMENMSNYSETFVRKGGHFEVIGLDDSKSGSEHPFALRKILPKQMVPFDGVLTKRQKSIQQISEEMHWKYDAFSAKEMEELPSFGFFRTRKIDKVSNVLSNEDCTIFDVQYSEGELIAKEVIKATMLHIHTKKAIPNFTLDKEGIFEYILDFAGYTDIDFEKHPDFSKRFYLAGENEENIRAFFTDDLILFLESNKQYHIEATKNGLLIIGKGRLKGIKEIKALAYFGMGLQKTI